MVKNGESMSEIVPSLGLYVYAFNTMCIFSNVCHWVGSEKNMFCAMEWFMRCHPRSLISAKLKARTQLASWSYLVPFLNYCNLCTKSSHCFPRLTRTWPGIWRCRLFIRQHSHWWGFEARRFQNCSFFFRSSPTTIQ